MTKTGGQLNGRFHLLPTKLPLSLTPHQGEGFFFTDSCQLATLASVIVRSLALTFWGMLLITLLHLT